MGAKRQPAVDLRRVGEDRIDGRHHERRVAPRVVALQQHAVQTLDDEVARRLEDLGLGAAEAIDALLRVADDEHRRRPLATGAAAGAGIRRQPAVQRLPLQRAGVLELVDEQLAHAQVQPLLHPTGHLGVTQQGFGGTLQIGHVDKAALALEFSVAGQQHARQRQHLLVVNVRRLLAAHRLDGLQRRYHGRQQWRRAQVQAQRALVGEERLPGQRKGLAGVALRQRQQQAGACLLRRRLGGSAELARQRRDVLRQRGLQQQLGRVGQAGAGRPHRGGRRHGTVGGAGGVGTCQLGSAEPGRLEPAQQGAAAVPLHQRDVDRAQRRIGLHGTVKAAEEFVAQHRGVFDRFIGHRQVQALQQRQRCMGQQLPEPGVESAHLDTAALAQQPLVKAAQRIGRGFGLRQRHATLLQGQHARCRCAAATGMAGQPLVEARTHLARRLAREGDGQHLLRLDPGEQGAQDARDQHPGLAGTGTGLDDDAACRVAGGGVESLGAGRVLTDAVGRFHPLHGLRGRRHGAAQWSRRHRPRASQVSHTGPSPSAGRAAPSRRRCHSSPRPCSSVAALR